MLNGSMVQHFANTMGKMRHAAIPYQLTCHETNSRKQGMRPFEVGTMGASCVLQLMMFLVSSFKPFFLGGSALLYLFLFRVCSHGLVAKDWKEEEEKQISVEKGWKSCYLCIRCFALGALWVVIGPSILILKSKRCYCSPYAQENNFRAAPKKKTRVDSRIWCAWPIEFRNLDLH